MKDYREPTLIEQLTAIEDARRINGDEAGAAVIYKTRMLLLNAPQSRVSDDTLSGEAVALPAPYVGPFGYSKHGDSYRIEDTGTDTRVATCYLQGNAEFVTRMLNGYTHPPITTGGCYRKCGGGSLDYCTVHSGLFIDNAATRCDAAPSAPVTTGSEAIALALDCLDRKQYALAEEILRNATPSAPVAAPVGDAMTDLDTVYIPTDADRARVAAGAAPPSAAGDAEPHDAICTVAGCVICETKPVTKEQWRALSPTPAEGDREEAAKRELLEAIKENTWAEPSVSVMHRAIDRLADAAALRRPVVDEGVQQVINEMASFECRPVPREYGDSAMLTLRDQLTRWCAALTAALAGEK